VQEVYPVCVYAAKDLGKPNEEVTKKDGHTA